MQDPVDHLAAAADIVAALKTIGLEAVLVGGMALVVLGSRRVTRDFDFLVPHPGARLADTVGLFYDRRFELVSSLTGDGDVQSTISTRRVAIARLRIDRPEAAFFFNHGTGLRIDLLFDFPIPAADVAERAARTTIRAHQFAIASEEDLLRLKQIAASARSAPGDADDIAFLEARLKRRREN
ncbi:MAG TPA: hypothetical protein VIC33_17380 [Vicinamibacterales bacterium]|jgi:hypothetical protein